MIIFPIIILVFEFKNLKIGFIQYIITSHNIFIIKNEVIKNFRYLNDKYCRLYSFEKKIKQNIAYLNINQFFLFEIKLFYGNYNIYFQISKKNSHEKLKLAGIKNPSKFLNILTDKFNYKRKFENVNYETYVRMD
ncbi:MAG: hypothetical protein EAX96_14700 [Candidatus Lokiarchaeota archaeon]|nr:hypothetical protein [Candidatus Lokiarchaeota archaeon]